MSQSEIRVFAYIQIARIWLTITCRILLFIVETLREIINNGFSRRILSLGFNCNIAVTPDKSKLTGRLGGTFVGADVNLDLVDFPPMIASILAATVYKIYLEKSRQK